MWFKCYGYLCRVFAASPAYSMAVICVIIKFFTIIIILYYFEILCGQIESEWHVSLAICTCICLCVDWRCTVTCWLTAISTPTACVDGRCVAPGRPASCALAISVQFSYPYREFCVHSYDGILCSILYLLYMWPCVCASARLKPVNMH